MVFISHFSKFHSYLEWVNRFLKSSSLWWSHGSHIRFWLDPWCREVILKQIFPAPFRMAWNKETYMVAYMCWNNKVLHWDILFTRSVHDWEMEIFQYFLVLLYSQNIGRVRDDCICWIHASSSILKLSPTIRLS